jgi:hypothetical protein
MKQTLNNILILSCIWLFMSCKETREDIQPQSLESYTITPVSGGVTISYPVPNDPNILYVMAEYKRNGELFTERSSIYKSSVTIEGFNTTDKVTATLYTVNYHETRSEPVSVEFTPLESPIAIAYRSLILSTGFGGIVAQWENQAKTELGVRLMCEVDGKLTDKEMYFSAIPAETHAFRGFEDVETTFALSFEDKWGNISDTTYFTTTPIAELEVPKPFGDMRSVIPYDNTTENPTFNWPRLFNKAVGDDSWLTVSSEQYGPSFTIDLKDTYKLNRMTIWPRMRPNTPTDVYTVNNVLVFEMWGTKEIDNSKLPPADKGYWLEKFTESAFKHEGVTIAERTFADDWVYLGRHAVERLDLLGASTEDITNRAREGEQFELPAGAEPVRYIRFFVIETDKGAPTPGNLFQIGELSFFGNNKITQ